MLELDNILVIHRLKQLSFLFEQLDALFLQSLAFDDLHCDLFISLFVYRAIDCAEGSLTQHTLKLVVVRIRLAFLKLSQVARNLLRF